jgi:alkanesulfonate monooxygenase SsuD/methylene tetrahydromethanopterin reductase-like flavin-dependent oxidoreductase (luciferase family)
MDLGLFMMPAHPPERELSEAHRIDLDMIQLADQLGYREAWVGEHFTQTWEPIPAPDLMIAQALLQTEQIVLAPGAHILPFHHPAGLAHRLAYLDHVARGRLMLGIGSGSTPTDWAMFGIEDNVQAREMMWESLAIMQRLWTERDPFTFEGKYWKVQQPAGMVDDGMSPHITCFQTPHIPVGTAGLSPRSPTLREAGSRGLIPLSLALSTHYLAGHWEVISEGAEEAGGTADPGQWRVGREILVAETDADARRLAIEGNMGRTWREWFLPAYSTFGFLTCVKHDPELPDSEVTLDYLADNVWLIGSPDTIVEKIERIVDEVGPFGVLLAHSYDYGDDQDAWNRSMELLATEVLPRVQGLTPSPSGIAGVGIGTAG